MRRLLALTLCTLILPLLPFASADEKSSKIAKWLHWRGPTAQGYVSDERVPLTWSEKENLLWKIDLPGDGHSSPIIWGDRIFLTGTTGGGTTSHVFCVRTSDGKMLWKQVAARDQPKERTHLWHGHASPSCATDGKYVYAFFGSPGIFCYDVDGKFIWKKTFGKFISKAGWGVAASPFLYEDTVIVNCDNDSEGGKGEAPSVLVALDKKTGDVKWTTPRNQGRGFSTPRLLKMADGRTDLVLNGPQGVWGYDPKTGKERWRCRRSDRGDQHQFGEPIPVDDGERMFVLSGRTGPWQIIKMPGEGDVTKTNVLHTDRRGLRDVASPIVVNGKVYCVDRTSMLTVFDIKTGKVVHSQQLARKGINSMASPIQLRGKLLWLLDEGTTVVVEPGDKPRIVGRNKLPGGKFDFGASPAVADGRMFLRSRTALYCIGEKK